MNIKLDENIPEDAATIFMANKFEGIIRLLQYCNNPPYFIFSGHLLLIKKPYETDQSKGIQ
jgi:hypothetical protein